jgi:hypothetical protein
MLLLGRVMLFYTRKISGLLIFVREAMFAALIKKKLITLSEMSVRVKPGNTKGGSITVRLTSCLTGLESTVLLLTICLYLFAKQTNPNQSNRRSMVQ